MDWRWTMPEYVNPHGCTWCAVGKHEHAVTWHKSVGYHSWAAPTDTQIKERMLANRERGC